MYNKSLINKSQAHIMFIFFSLVLLSSRTVLSTSLLPTTNCQQQIAIVHSIFSVIVTLFVLIKYTLNRV